MESRAPYARSSTVRDRLETPEDGDRYELLGGLMLREPPPAIRHRYVVGNLFVMLTATWTEQGTAARCSWVPSAWSCPASTPCNRT